MPTPQEVLANYLFHLDIIINFQQRNLRRINRLLSIPSAAFTLTEYNIAKAHLTSADQTPAPDIPKGPHIVPVCNAGDLQTLMVMLKMRRELKDEVKAAEGALYVTTMFYASDHGLQWNARAE